MDFNFDWNYISAGAPYITISSTGLAFNTPSINLLGNPEKIVLGFDKNRMAIGAMDADDAENAKSYLFRSRIKNGWVRIGCKDFVNYLSVLSGIDFSTAKKFVAHYDSADRLLYAFVEKDGKEADR